MSKFDVAIVGGGVIGISIAFELSAQKLRVVVLDRQSPGQEASWAAAGMLSPTPDSPRDIPLVPLGRESLKLYPQFVTAIEDESGKSVNYAREGALEILFSPDGETDGDRTVSEWRGLGLAAELVSPSVARLWEPSITSHARTAVWLPEEETVEPRLLIDALLAAARRRGVQIRPNCPVTGLLQDRERCVGVVAGGEEIAAGRVVVAAGCFCSEIARETNTVARYAPTRPVRGQMLALRPDALKLQRVLRSERGYLVPRKDGQIVAGSTSEEAGFEKRITPAGVRKILDAALELCPGLASAAIVDAWCGLRPGTPDDLPILGPAGVEGLMIATGHYRNGILLAPVTAKLVREWIMNGSTTFDAQPFSPLRFRRASQPRSARHSAD
ncbi:MAG: glycine oxidase ThiO [Candidatus Acidiferrales bacterium]